jgi:hypothetical protein
MLSSCHKKYHGETNKKFMLVVSKRGNSLLKSKFTYRIKGKYSNYIDWCCARDGVGCKSRFLTDLCHTKYRKHYPRHTCVVPFVDDLTPEELNERQIEKNEVLPGPLPKTKAIGKTKKRAVGYNY